METGSFETLIGCKSGKTGFLYGTEWAMDRGGDNHETYQTGKLQINLAILYYTV
jgi:hypothetical protein